VLVKQLLDYEEGLTVLKWVKYTMVLVIFLSMFIVAADSFAGLDDESLVLYLSFDEGNGNKAKDSSIYKHDGELVANPSWVDGQFDSQALEFDGSKSQYVKIPINDTLQLREKFSIAFWVKRGPVQAANWNYMVSAGSLVWATIFNSGDQKTYFWSKAPGWTRKGITDENQPQDWVHIAVTHDIGTDVSIYYDGKKVGGGPKPPAIIQIDGSVMVGARHPGLEFFTGIIDEVYLFNRILPVDEISMVKDGAFLSVEPADKLATRWGFIKAEHKK